MSATGDLEAKLATFLGDCPPGEATPLRVLLRESVLVARAQEACLCELETQVRHLTEVVHAAGLKREAGERKVAVEGAVNDLARRIVGEVTDHDAQDDEFWDAHAEVVGLLVPWLRERGAL